MWLEGTNLHTTHPTLKLRLKQFGSFEIIKELSLVTYRLTLSVTWRLHNVFHMVILFPYKKIAIHGTNYPKLTPELIKREPEWEIKAILASHHYRRI